MPTITETPVTAYAHCVAARCPGNRQQEVEALSRNESFPYFERGGDLPGEENSWVRIVFAHVGVDGDRDDTLCPHCGGPRDISADPRRQYANISGHNPMGLLDVDPFDPRKQTEAAQQPVSDEERRHLEAENEALRAQLSTQAASIARLEGFMLGKQSAAEAPEMQDLPEEPEPGAD